MEHIDFLNSRGAAFSSAEWADIIQSLRVLIVGLGGIGSHAAFNIGRLNPRNIDLVDNDYIEIRNLSGQLYNVTDIGMSKANQVRIKLLEEMSSYFYSTSWGERITSDNCNTYMNLSPDIVICAVDNMETRRIMWKAFKKSKAEVFIDGRLSIDTLQIYTILKGNNSDYTKYEKSLFKDEEAEETVCTLKQTTHISSIIGALIANNIVKYASNLVNPTMHPLGPPFYIEFNGTNLEFIVEQ